MLKIKTELKKKVTPLLPVFLSFTFIRALMRNNTCYSEELHLNKFLSSPSIAFASFKSGKFN